MPVAQRGKRFLATVHHNKERYRRSFETAVEATAWEAESLARLARGEAPIMAEGAAGAPQTMEALAALCHAHFWKGSKSERTTMINVRTVISHLGNPHPSKVTTVAVDTLIMKWKGMGSSDSTINRRLAVLSKMMRFAEDRGFIPKRPKIERRREPEGRIRYYTPEEEQKILEWFRHNGEPDMEDLTITAIDTGLRKGELLRLKHQDIDLKDGTIHVYKTKTSRPRVVPMTKRVKDVLTRRTENLKHGDAIFPGMTEATTRWSWDQLRLHLKVVDDPHFVFHTLRHTFVSRLVQRGAQMFAVAELAGHSTLTTTRRYSHLAPKDLSNTVSLLDGK